MYVCGRIQDNSLSGSEAILYENTSSLKTDSSVQHGLGKRRGVAGDRF